MQQNKQNESNSIKAFIYINKLGGFVPLTID